MTAPIIVWFRRNLRLTDNRALSAACDTGRPIIGLYVHDSLDAGGASQWWLHQSLASLKDALQSRGCNLLVRNGVAEAEIRSVIDASGATELVFSRRYEPAALAQEKVVVHALGGDFDIEVFEDYLLRSPRDVLNLSGAPYKVFTPFWKASTQLGEPEAPLPAPETIVSCTADIASLDIEELSLTPRAPDWAGGLREHWQPGEDGALQQLGEAAEIVGRYTVDRDRPDLDGTSRLSPYLHFGEISPRQVWHSINSRFAGVANRAGADAMLRQLYWREFSWYLLVHFPTLPDNPLRPEFEHFPWSNDPELLKAWQQGQTGYPLIDAGMRQLWATGWMHNRVRMVVASFLVKNLMIDWQTGAEWFLDTLVDADLANNSAGWQWVAGCGTDAAPYFRIFNPVRQSEKFDPDGDYIRRWVPELAELPNEFIHEPWKADAMAQQLANVRIGEDYPLPIVDLGETRKAALDAYQQVRSLLQSPAVSPGSSAG